MSVRRRNRVRRLQRLEREGFQTHGVDIKDSSPNLQDKIALIWALWQQEIGSDDREYVRLNSSCLTSPLIDQTWKTGFPRK